MTKNCNFYIDQGYPTMKQLIFILFLSPFLSFGQFEDAKSFSEGLAVVRTGGLWGAIDSKGNMVIEPIYQNLLSFKEGLAVAKKESLYGAINKKGEVIIDFKFSELSSFENGVSECEYEIDSISKYYRGIYSFNGLIDKKGNFFSNSLIHNLNKDTMPTEVYNWFLKEKKELIIRYTDFNKKYKTQYYGGVNYKGDTIIPFIYDKIETKTDNRYLLRNSDGWSLVTNKNETIVSANNGIRQISNFYEIRNRKNGKIKRLYDE